MRLTKIYWKRFKAPLALAAGIAAGAAAASYAVAAAMEPTVTVTPNVAPVQTSAPEPETVVEEGGDLADWLRQLQIVGYVQMGSKSHYHFTRRDSEPTAQGYPVVATSADLIRMGIRFAPINECLARATTDGVEVSVYCR